MSQVAEALGVPLQGNDVLMTGVSKDTRSISNGDLYVALVGDRFDGHQFVKQATESGAVGVLVSNEQVTDVAQIEVADTRLALGQLASYWRDKYSGKLIGITGSNGKTSVKEMCKKILVDYAGLSAVLSTKGNLNNDIGMPLMLLELTEKHQYAVIEMGANHLGEISYLTSLAKPDVAILNNVGPAHLEGFGSLDNIAHAKAEIYEGLDDNGVAIINLDDVYSPMWLKHCAEAQPKNRIVRFSMKNNDADVFAKHLSQDSYQIIYTLNGKTECASLKLKVPGDHNVMNALAAISATLSVGVPLQSIVTSLSDFENIEGRLTIKKSENGYQVIDDTYNANPLSVSAAIDVLAQMQGETTDKTVLVLGDMAELGKNAEKLHAEMGSKAKNAGIQALYATGKLSANTVDAFGDNGFYYPTKNELIKELRKSLTGNEIILVKGSRSAAMEEVVERILTHDNNYKRVN